MFLKLQSTNMENNTAKIIEQTEFLFHNDLHGYLSAIGRVDNHMPEAPDLEELWPKLAQSYLPDGVREFTAYPTASLGWMMYIGMALAKYWDEDWALYSKVEDLYKYLRDRIDFDHMDEYIMRNVLLLDEDTQRSTTDTVAECASRTYNLLMHQHLEPGTPEAFRAYVAALHQLYLMGMAMQLKAMGYHMTKM